MFKWLRNLILTDTLPSAPSEPPARPRSERLPLNVPGPFYTCGDCLWCGLPQSEAPDLLAPLKGDNTYTYFAKQPQTPEEIERACKAIMCCCVSDLRYGGTDPSIIAQLENEPEVCDYVVRGGQVVPSQ